MTCSCQSPRSRRRPSSLCCPAPTCRESFRVEQLSLNPKLVPHQVPSQHRPRPRTLKHQNFARPKKRRPPERARRHDEGSRTSKCPHPKSTTMHVFQYSKHTSTDGERASQGCTSKMGGDVTQSGMYTLFVRHDAKERGFAGHENHKKSCS